ncbi:MAG: hypothetical protein VX740_06635, partial [Pseudomonadota bacterium]|nr:hypothetical protein [Pseudomonadota bacterium]
MSNFGKNDLIWMDNKLCSSFQQAAMSGVLTPAMMAQSDPRFSAQMGVSPAFNGVSMPAQNIVIPNYEVLDDKGRGYVTNPYSDL